MKKSRVRAFAVAAALLGGSATAIASTWFIENQKDPMTDKTVVTATARSDNTLDLSFPYQGENHGFLYVRRRGKELSVVAGIDRGQIPCMVTGCHVTMRFDENKPMRLSASESATHNSNLVFVNSEARVFAELKKAKHVRVQVDVYNQGSEVLDFGFPAPLDMK